MPVRVVEPKTSTYFQISYLIIVNVNKKLIFLIKSNKTPDIRYNKNVLIN